MRRRRTVRRRTFGMTAVAAVTVALAGASVLATTPPVADDEPQIQVARPGGELWRFTFAVDDIPGYRLVYRSRGAEQQIVWAFPEGAVFYPYAIEVYGAGTYDPTAVRTGEPVRVNGKPGFYQPDMTCERCAGTDAVLAWEYAPDAWALVQDQNQPTGRPKDKSALLRIAEAVRFHRTAPLRLPFKVDYLPDGLSPAPSTDRLDSDSVRNSGTTGPVVSLSGANPEDPGLDIVALGPREMVDPIGEPVVSEDGPFGPMVQVNLGQFQVQLYSGSPGKPGLPTEELVRIARSITAADITNPATWFDVEQAIPET